MVLVVCHECEKTVSSEAMACPNCGALWDGVAGGVASVGHPEPLRTIVDISLAQYDVVWAAGGHPHCVFPTSYDDLLRITAGEAAEMGA